MSNSEYNTPYNCNIEDIIQIDENAKFERIYLISGLRRSGNHLLLQLLNCVFDDNSILFINDFPSLMANDSENQEEQYYDFTNEKKFKKALVNISYGHSTFKCEQGQNTTKLMTPNTINNLKNESKNWTIKSKKILIMSFEDQYIFRMDMVENSLKSHCTNIKKIIIIRDILNCFSSRIKALCERNKNYQNIDPLFEKIVKKGTYFKTDYTTLDIWKEHLYKSYYNNSEYIVFNYNIFLCDEDKKKELITKLDIKYNPELFKYTSTFGHGSSYDSVQTATNSIIKYYSRFNEPICDNNLKEFFKNIFLDKQIINYLNEYFKMKILQIDDNNYMLDICDETHNKTLIDMKNILNGGKIEQYYKNKYEKYKIKYNNLKNSDIFF